MFLHPDSVDLQAVRHPGVDGGPDVIGCLLTEDDVQVTPVGESVPIIEDLELAIA